jgi:DNA polymerase III subunit gamma/tau
MASLANRYRPTLFKEVVGNEGVTRSLTRLLSRDTKRIPNAFLFSGSAGTGKTTLARILAKKLGCAARDVVELNSSDYRGIDAIREIKDAARLKPFSTKSKCKVWIWDECHGLTPQAQENALKLLEDGPTHAYFILCTTEPDKLKPTLKRRCTHYELSSLGEDELQKRLESVAQAEGTKVSQAAVQNIVQSSMGSLGIALAILEHVLDLPLPEQAKAAERFAEQRSALIHLCRALIKGRPWKEIAKIIRTLDGDAESIRRGIVGYANAVLLSSGSRRAYIIMDCFAGNFYDVGKPGISIAAYEASNRRE